MRGILPLAKEILRLPASIGTPENSDFISGTSIDDPMYASVIGTILLAHRYGISRHKTRLNFSLDGFWGSLKSLAHKIIP
jgi:hypothetical protein